MSRIDDLIAAMTLTEKLGQLTMTTAGYAVTGPVATTDLQAGILLGPDRQCPQSLGADAVKGVQQLALEQTRLKIPLLVGMDVIHGHRTIFPIPLGETALFDPAAWEATARESAREAAADGVHSPSRPCWTWRAILAGAASPKAPARTPGGPGMARAKVKGFQGANLTAPGTLAACAKHYCAYGAVTAGREYAPADVSQRALHEVYLPPFEAAVAAGVATIMPAFTDLDGVPMTANSALLQGLSARPVVSWRDDQRLQRHRRTDPSWRGRRSGRGGGAGAEGRRGHRHDGERLSRRLAGGAQARAGDDGRYRCLVRRVLALKEHLGLFDNPYRRGARWKAPMCWRRGGGWRAMSARARGDAEE